MEGDTKDGADQGRQSSQTGIRREMGSWSYLPQRRVAPAQRVHQLCRKPMSAVGKESVIGGWSAPPARDCPREGGQKGPVSGQWPPGQQEGGGGLDPRVSVCVYRVAGYPVGLGVGWGGQERSKDGELDAHWVQG